MLQEDKVFEGDNDNGKEGQSNVAHLRVLIAIFGIH